MNLSRKTILGLFSIFVIVSANAHEAMPMHGGVITEVREINYELVAKSDSIALYVTDHGKPVDVKGAAATVTLISADDKTETKLTPTGENKLEAKGAFAVKAGVKAIASVTLPGQSAESVRFTIQ